jgi:Fe-S cluster assembly protein SufD
MFDLLLKQQSELEKCGPAWLQELRAQGLQQFQRQGLPHAKSEAWKYTSVKPLSDIPFTLGHPYKPEAVDIDHLACTRFGQPQGIRISLVNGRFAPSLSYGIGNKNGVQIKSLAQALRDDPDWIRRYLGTQAPVDREPFVALNTAFIDDGAVIRIPKGGIVKEPIELSCYTLPNGSFCASHPRLLVVAEAGSQASVIVTYAGRRGEKPYFTNAVTEIFVEPSAILHHYRLQDECEQSYHLSSLGVRQGRDSRFSSTGVSIGSRLSRHEINCLLAEPGADCALHGLYMAHGAQHVDHQTKIDHAKPHGTSRELFKGIMDDQAHGVFNGQILVREKAEKTRSSLTNNNLLLSREAKVDTKPLLEIFNDDVKCSHGATIGRLDENQIFYLRSRGLDQAFARNLLSYAFASEIVQELKFPALRSHLEEILLNRLHIPELTVEGLR